MASIQAHQQQQRFRRSKRSTGSRGIHNNNRELELLLQRHEKPGKMSLGTVLSARAVFLISMKTPSCQMKEILLLLMRRVRVKRQLQWRFLLPPLQRDHPSRSNHRSNNRLIFRHHHHNCSKRNSKQIASHIPLCLHVK
jgi:hypothetical protein